jgi:sec-independent protein translocase protein TatA
MFAIFDSPTDWLIIAAVVLVLFGGSQLPKLAKNLGQAQNEFKKGLEAGKASDPATPAATPPATPKDDS